MKKLMFTLCIISVLPMAVLAKYKPPILYKPSGNSIVPGSAFSKPPVRAVGSCQGSCVNTAGDILSHEAIKAVNGQTLQGKNAEVVGKVLELVPVISAKSQIAGVPTRKSNTMVDSLVAAATQSVTWNDPAAQNKVLELVVSLTEDGGVQAQKEILEKLEKECRL